MYHRRPLAYVELGKRRRKEDGNRAEEQVISWANKARRKRKKESRSERGREREIKDEEVAGKEVEGQMAGQPGCTSIQGAYASTALWCTFPVVLISFIFSYPLKEEGELGMRPRRNKAGGGFERASKLCCSFQLLEAVYHANFGIHSVHRQ